MRQRGVTTEKTECYTGVLVLRSRFVRVDGTTY